MPRPRKFLIIDDIADSRALIVRTLMRKFPAALVQECQECATAVAAAASETFDVILVHRAVEVDGITMTRMVRQVNPDVPIVMISGIDRTRPALEAGATRFHNYDEWLRIGTVVAEILEGPRAKVEEESETANPFSTKKDSDGKATAPVA
jgi:DNA-binding NtrC family response regulator